MERVLAFARSKKKESQLDFDFLTTDSNLEKYLGSPPIIPLVKATQTRKSAANEAQKKVVADPSRGTATEKGKGKATESTLRSPVRVLSPKQIEPKLRLTATKKTKRHGKRKKRVVEEPKEPLLKRKKSENR